MFNSSVLDIALGMVFIYLVLSLACTAAHEALERFMSWRSSDLERGLQEFLQDREGHESGIVAQLYNHPLIDSLFRGDYVPPSLRRRGAATSPPAAAGAKPTKLILPAYIPSRNFALALLDIIQAGGPDRPSGASGATPPRDDDKTGADPVAAAVASPPDLGPDPTSSLRRAIAASPLLEGNPEVRRALFALVDAAGNDMGQVRANIETWYNSGMDRVSGWFKQRSQVISLAFAAAITLLVNADSVMMGNALARDKALREALVATAQDYSKREIAAARAGDPGAQPQKYLQSSLEILRPLELPVGWQRHDLRWDFASTFHRVLGWIITTLAVSLGAPFWFDMLNKFMIVRSTVKPHEKSPEEGSRD